MCFSGFAQYYPALEDGQSGVCILGCSPVSHDGERASAQRALQAHPGTLRTSGTPAASFCSTNPSRGAAV